MEDIRKICRKRIKRKKKEMLGFFFPKINSRKIRKNEREEKHEKKNLMKYNKRKKRENSNSNTSKQNKKKKGITRER